jgi:pyruvate dehydrogenase phosphatase
LNTPARLLAEHISEESKKTNTIPDLSQHPLALTAMQPAISGMSMFFGLI